jgi:hypothetical protein
MLAGWRVSLGCKLCPSLLLDTVVMPEVISERSCVDWIKRYVEFHEMIRREDLADGERKIEAFLTDLVVRGKVAASTQNQAFRVVEG